MLKNDQKILTVQEYGPFLSINEAARSLGLTKDVFWTLLWGSIKSFGQESYKDNFIERVGADSFRFIDIAGILALKPGVRIEIVPKFLNPDSPSWRDDFLSIALVTHHGHLLQNIPVSSRPTKNLDLYEIVADTWINLFEINSRSLIRTYVNTEWSDFQLDGEANEEDLHIPSEKGFLQKGLKLSRSNPANILLRSSANLLINRISNPRNLARLNRAVSILTPTIHERHTSKKGQLNYRRQINWLPLIELSETVMNNFSLGFSEFGTAFLPGYIIRTQYAWERLMFLAIKKAYPEFTVSKTWFTLGNRISATGSRKKVEIVPDINIIGHGKHLVIDAKYKTTRDLNSTTKTSIVSVADIYEANAYLKVTGTKKMLLLYPGIVSNDLDASELPIEVFESDDLKISAHTVDVTGIALRKGLSKLAEALRNRVSTYLS